MAEVSANCGEQAADIGRNALSHVKKITETTGLPKCSRFLEVPDGCFIPRMGLTTRLRMKERITMPQENGVNQSLRFSIRTSFS